MIVSINGGGDAAGAGGGINQISITAGGTVRTSIDANSVQGAPSFTEAFSRCGGPMTLVVDESGSIGSCHRRGARRCSPFRPGARRHTGQAPDRAVRLGVRRAGLVGLAPLLRHDPTGGRRSTARSDRRPAIEGQHQLGGRPVPDVLPGRRIDGSDHSGDRRVLHRRCADNGAPCPASDSGSASCSAARPRRPMAGLERLQVQPGGVQPGGLHRQQVPAQRPPRRCRRRQRHHPVVRLDRRPRRRLPHRHGARFLQPRA